nr:hypothetical protein [Streptacidiphilus rugosus]
MLADAEVGGVLHLRLLVGHAQLVGDELARRQRDEGVTAEEAGPYGRPLGLPGGVVEVDLVHRADLLAVLVHGLVADQIPGVDLGLHAVPLLHRPRRSVQLTNVLNSYEKAQ